MPQNELKAAITETLAKIEIVADYCRMGYVSLQGMQMLFETLYK